MVWKYFKRLGQSLSLMPLACTFLPLFPLHRRPPPPQTDNLEKLFKPSLHSSKSLELVLSFYWTFKASNERFYNFSQYALLWKITVN